MEAEGSDEGVTTRTKNISRVENQIIGTGNVSRKKVCARGAVGLHTSNVFAMIKPIKWHRRKGGWSRNEGSWSRRHGTGTM